MAEGSEDPVHITKPGIVALGEGLPPSQLITALCEDNTVSQISCGVDHSAVVLASGQVYMFGKGLDNGWMELDENVISPPTVLSSLSHVRVVQVSCGKRFTVFLTDKGEVYSCGLNGDGQLGLGHTNKCPMPELVTGLPSVKKVAAGYGHALVLTETGEVWGTGCNYYGQLGCEPNQNQSSFIRINNISGTITDIACGARHSALLLGTGVVLVTGFNRCGQIGLNHDKNISIFTPVSVPSAPITAVSCGMDHTVALRVNGSVWSWGDNSCGQLGTGDKSKRLTPTPVITLEGYTISEIIAAQDHTALLTSEGDVLCFGMGINGELGKTKENITLPTLMKKSPELVVKQVAFAHTYSLMLIAPKEVDSSTVQEEREVNTELKPNKVCVSELEKSIMKSLECPICFKIMSSPIHQCTSGHSVCATCQSNTPNCSLCRESHTNVRNLNLEHLGTVIPLPCVDCLERMPANLLEKHGDVCLYRKYDCPVQQLCGWSGRPEAMLAHTASSHPNQAWQNLPHLFIYSTLDDGVVHTNVLAAHCQVFTLHRRYDKNSGKFQVFLRYIGPPEDVKQYKFKITFINVDDCNKSMFLNNVCVDTENIDSLYESPSCVSLNIDSLEPYLCYGKLVCEVDVMKDDYIKLSENIKWSLRL